jgi:hypothetical protein
VWVIDLQFDETIDRRRLKLTNIFDEHTRQALAMRVARQGTGEDFIVELERLVVEFRPPSFLRCDNGPELIADALREWCRCVRIGISYIEPGSKRAGLTARSTGSPHRGPCRPEEFGSLLESQVVLDAPGFYKRALS